MDPTFLVFIFTAIVWIAAADLSDGKFELKYQKSLAPE